MASDLEEVVKAVRQANQTIKLTRDGKQDFDFKAESVPLLSADSGRPLSQLQVAEAAAVGTLIAQKQLAK